MRNKAVFIDLDGTLIEDTVYMSNPIKLRPETVTLIRDINSENYHLLIIISNQSGINKKLFDEKYFCEKMFELMIELNKQNIYIDDVFYCPHTPEEDCFCRKPKTGMIDLANAKYDLDLNECTFIGDKDTDKELADKVNMKFVKV